MTAVVWRRWSLRHKLIAAGVVVQLAAGAALQLSSMRLLQGTLVEQAAVETRQVLALLDQAIAAPLAQRDYATLQQTLDLVRSDAAIHYLVVTDHRGQPVASAGWDAARPLPPRDTGEIDLRRADSTLHLGAPIQLAGQPLGRVDVGLSTDRLHQAQATFFLRSLHIGVVALLLSGLALAVIALAITRHLARLAQATQRVARGDFDVQVVVTTGDEIGQLGAGFNAMALALKERVAALEVSEAQQRVHLDTARAEQARLTTLLGAMQGGILFVDAADRVIYANSAFARIWRLPEPAAGQRLADIVPLLLTQVEPGDAPHLQAMLQHGEAEPAGQRELRTVDGRTLVQRMQPVAAAATVQGRIWFHDDITLERQTQQRAHQALYDPLTALLNRRGLLEALQAAIAQASALPRGELTLLFIDLDDFKHANDVGGHRTGDEILVAVARALSGQLRKGEVVARLGGDEFAVLCPGLGTVDAGGLAARLVDAVAALRFEAAAQTLRVGCSIGIAAYPADARSGDELVACADAAMYQAKQGGKNGWARFQGHPPTQAETDRPSLDARLHRALQGPGLVLHFQPVHRASDLQVSHHEALVRLVDEHDPGRLISPADFIAHAERSGQVRQIDRWVFENTVARLAAEDASLCMSANLSARSLEDASFAGFLRDVLQRHDVDPRRLLIELTASVASLDPLAVRHPIDALRQLGCAVHLDDFGRGSNTFAQLRLLEVDAIKIDGSFVRSVLSDASTRLFVAAIIDIAHHLNKTVVAEHVEDAATLEMLRGMGVDLVQGFHFSRPSARFVDVSSRPRLHVIAGSR